METWEHAQGVDSSSLGNMGAPKRLYDPIGTPTRSHDDRNKEEHKARGVHPRMGHVGPRDTTIDRRIDSFGCTRSTKGCDDSFECDGS
jgi:hypothetical protein